MQTIASYKTTMYVKVITAALHEIGKHYSILTVYPSGHIQAMQPDVFQSWIIFQIELNIAI